MELGNQTSFNKASATTIQHLGFLDRLHTKAQDQPESVMGHAAVADLDVDLREIYFLIMHFLSAGPCQRTFSQFCNELLEYQLLPKRYHAWYSRNGEVTGEENDDGISFPLSYEGVARRYSHIDKDHLVKLLKQLLLHVAPSRGIFGKSPPTAADVPTLLGIGPFSLLGCNKNEAGPHVKPLPAYLRWPHMQADQVRGIGLREIGGGFPKHHRAPSIRFASYAIAKPSTMVQKMQNIKKLRGHRDAVYCAIFDRTGRYVITGSDDRLVKIWSMETAFCLASCRGHEGDITDLAVNLNNTLVASASNDYNIRVWRLPDGMPISVLRGHTGAVTAIAFSPRHSSVFQLLSSSDDGTCRIWDARASQFCARIYVPKQTNEAAGSNNGPSSSTSNPQNNSILCCAYNANGTIFVTGSSDTFARVWSACKPNIDDSQQPVHEMDVLAGHENDVNYVQFSGCAVASRSDTLADDKVPKLKTSWYSHDNIVTCSRDGSAIIWIPRSRKSHGKVGRWTRAYHLKVPPPPMPPQPRRGGPRQRFLPTPRGVNMIVWSLDNRFVLAAIMDCRICVWNASDGRLVHSLTGHSESTYVLDVHPFNPRIAMSSGYDGKTIIWDIWEGIPIRIYEIGRFKLVDGKFSPDGTSIVLSDDVGQIYLLNTGQGESQKDAKYDQFFLGDYRPLARDAHGNVVDEETQLPPYRRNIQDALCDSSMLPYPEPYQSNYQRRRLGALKLEWRPPSLKFAVGTDIGLGQEYQMLPLADLDVVAEPPPEFLDAVFWEPENDIIIDSTDSEYNVTEDSEDEQVISGNSSGDAAESSGGNNKDDGSRRRSKRKKPKDSEWTSSSGRRVKRRNTNEHEGTSSRNKRTKKSRNNRNNAKVTSSRAQRASVRNGKKFSSQDISEDEEDEYVSVSVSEHNSSESHPDIEELGEEEEKEEEEREEEEEEEEKPKVSIPPESKESKPKLVLKFSLTKKSPASQNTQTTLNRCNEPSTSSRPEEEKSKPSENHNTTKPTIIRIKPSSGECSQTKKEDDNVPQKKKTIKLKFKTQNAKENDNSTEVDATKRQPSSHETNDAPQSHKNPVHLIVSNSSMASGSGSKSNDQLGKTNWLLLSGQEGRCRYIPQLGDEVAYFRQGHQEYIDSVGSSEREPWALFKNKVIRDVELCLVDHLDYVTVAGSGESGCKLRLKFIDPLSDVSGKSFTLTLPELNGLPEFLVERTRYENSLQRNWSVGDKCSVWWQDEGGGGNMWHGFIDSICDKSVDFPGSPWERYLVKYEAEDVRHSPWEFEDEGSEWEQPGIDPDIRKMMISLLAKLEYSARGNEDKYGIRKLKQTSERLDYINRFPVPLTLEIIELRVKNVYYRSLEAMKHDIKVMLSNVETYFTEHAEMKAKMKHLWGRFERVLSTL